MWREGSLLPDVRYGARLLLRQRGFSAVAIVTTALAIGVTVTLFSVFDAVLWRPLPWPRADRLVRLTETHAGSTREMPFAMTNTAYLALAHLSTLDGISAWSAGTATVGAGDRAERVASASITTGSFAVLRTPPLAGRDFTDDHATEVVVSYAFWKTRLGGATDAIGRPLTINGMAHTIVGIMPAGFDFPNRDTSVWRPLPVPPPPALAILNVTARLRDGATAAQAADEATARARDVSVRPNALLAVFGSAGPVRIAADPALDALTRDVRPGIVALLVAGALLFVMSIANLASLELARATTRHRELAIRTALGAGTRRVVQHLVVEHLLLAVAGGALGLALTLALHRALPALLPADFPRLQDITVRMPIVLVTFVLAAVTGIVLGALPVGSLRRLRLTEGLGEGAAGSIGGTRGRARSAIMTGQIGITAALLIVALLLGRSFVAMTTQDRGFDPSHLVTARLTLPDYAFAPAARIEAVEQFVSRARELPGAPVAAVTTGLPLSGSENITGFDMPSVRAPGTTVNVHAVRSVVTAGYVQALGLRLLSGRDFRAADDSPSAPKVVLVNRTFAREYLTAAAIGDRIRNFMTGDQVGFEVIGVVDDMQRKGLTERIQPEIYSLLRQSVRPSPTQDVVIRTATGGAPLADPLRRLVHDVAPAATIDAVRTMDDRIRGSLSRPRLYAVLLLVLAAFAVLIAAVGLAGVLSYTVAQRAREIAVRMALGARRRQIVTLVFRQGLVVTAIGLTAGLSAAAAAARFLGTLLYGVSSHDSLSFAAAAVVLGLVALAACTAPALRASRIDPLAQLRR